MHTVLNRGFHSEQNIFAQIPRRMIEVIAVALAGVFSILGIWLKIRWEKQRRPVTRTLKDIGVIYETMDVLVKTTSIERIMILKAQNGGGKPKVGKQLHARVLYQRYQDNSNIKLVDAKTQYAFVEVDEPYVRMLIETETTFSSKVVTSNLPEGSLLKTIYEAENVAFSEVFYLYETKEAFFYISLATSQEKERFQSAEDRNQINWAIGLLRYTFKSNYSKV